VKIKSLLFVVGSLFVSQQSSAATIYEVTAGYNYWKPEASVQVGEVADAQFNLAQDDESNTELYFSVEHPIPLVPNFKYLSSDYAVDGSQLLTETYILAGQTYRVASTLSANYQYEYTDYSLYYEVFDNQLLELDLGVTLKDIEANLAVANIDDATEASSRMASGIEPYLYTSAKVNLPLLNLGFSSVLNAKDSENYDFELAIQYKLTDLFIVKPYLQVGWKKQEANFDDFDSLYFKHSWDSAFAGIFFKF